MQKYFDSFPYSNFFASSDGDFLFFVRASESGKFLHQTSLKEPLNLESAPRVFDEDLNSRSFLPLRYEASRRRLYVIADENHDERYNLYQLDLDEGTLRARTHVDYAAGGWITPDGRHFYYGDRRLLNDRRFETTFRRLDLETDRTESYFHDAQWDDRIGWGQPAILEDSERVVVSVMHQNIRHRGNLAEVNLKTGSYRLLLPRSSENMEVKIAKSREHEGRIYFMSAQSGHTNLYAYEVRSGEITELTQFRQRHHGLSLLERDGQLYLVAVFPDPASATSKIHVLDLKNHRSWNRTFAKSCYLVEHERDLWISTNGISELPRRARLDLHSLETELEILAFSGGEKELVHSLHQFVKYSSFDGLEIPAYLSVPQRGPVRAAVVRAFYGGTDSYSFADQILLEQGIAVLSPAVRGSWGWGQDWERHLKGDLGGKEILDVVWGAKFLEKELNLSSAQIGVEGGSHGGYAVLRALTMPDQFLGQDSKYPWAFGLCWAGFADLIRFHEDSWIADWLTDLLGPLPENRALYVDRSPLTHFEELESPLFVVHGTHDRRVPTSTMTQFLEKLTASDKPHLLHFVEGQGHTGGDRQNLSRRYEAQQKFLDRYLWKPLRKEL